MFALFLTSAKDSIFFCEYNEKMKGVFVYPFTEITAYFIGAHVAIVLLLDWLQNPEECLCWKEIGKCVELLGSTARIIS